MSITGEGFPDIDPVTVFLDRLMKLGLENTYARRFYSKYEAIVTDTADPRAQGRIRVRVPATGWAQPLDIWAYPSAIYAGNNYGVVFTPERGDSVWVWFDHGDPTQPGFSGSWWLAPKKTRTSSYLPEEFKPPIGAEPSTRGVKTKAGHALLFEDDPARGSRVEVWTAKSNLPGQPATKSHVLVLTDDPARPRIAAVSAFGHIFVLDDNAQVIRIATPGGPNLELDQANALAKLISSGSIEIQALQRVRITGQELIHDFAGQAQLAYGSIQLQAQSASTLTFIGGVTLATSSAAMLLTGPTIQLLALAGGAITLGVAGTALRLVTQALIPIFNALVTAHNTLAASHLSHTHPFIGNLGVASVTSPSADAVGPTASPADIDSVTTNTTRAN